ncbi:hypothetical protein [Halorientalis marina]|uniref:hypothetical protein n=1 Tax=Halorientalis marina TaxID=2931976 RepID=UPI001FF1F32C|nr:hypothetical protein [Halorientalis marina]
MPDTDEEGEDEDREPRAILERTNRMPPGVFYDVTKDALCCPDCDSRYDPEIGGMRRAIECCDPPAEIDPDDVPVCACPLPLDEDDIEESDCSYTQLLFLQAVYKAMQQHFERLEYDIVWDSMLRLQEYVDIEDDAIDDLLDEGYLRKDCDHPHRLYTVTADGRDAIGVTYREGVAHGHGKGDLGESSYHVMLVEATKRWLKQSRVEDPDSPVARVVPYFELQEGGVDAAAFMGTDDEAAEQAAEEFASHRFDLVGLNGDGEVVLTLEAERVNHDLWRAAPDDYDKMAACKPDEAIWVVPTQKAGHEILQALNDPADGESRVEKTYAETTPTQQFRIDEPGFTAMYPVSWVQNQLESDE